MTLFEQIKADRLQARKDKNALKASVLSSLIGDITRDGESSDTSDAVVIAMIKKFIKGMDETIKNLGDDNPEATQTAEEEKIILEKYLPRQMKDYEIKTAILATYGTTFPSKGEIMKFLKEKFNGMYDGKVAAAVVDGLMK